MNTPDPTPRKITQADPPQFPCYLWCKIIRPFTGKPYGWEEHYTHPGMCLTDHFTYWLPDQPTKPTCVPDAPAAPTPEANAKRIQELVAEGRKHPAYDKPDYPLPTPEAVPQYVKDAAVELTQTFSVVSWKGGFHPELVSVVKADNPQLLSLLARHAPSPAVGQPSDTEMLQYALDHGLVMTPSAAHKMPPLLRDNESRLTDRSEVAAAMRADKQGRGEG